MLHANFMKAIARRQFLGSAAGGMGSIALSTLLHQDARSEEGSTTKTGADSELLAQGLHHPAKAKRVIFLNMSGGPSQLESFDYKPKLAELDGRPMPNSLTSGEQIAQLQGEELRCMAPQCAFARHGQSGQQISSFFPHTAKIADDICIVRSMTTNQINHDPAATVMNSGTAISNRPSMGSWLLYGIGSECENLPGFIVLSSKGGHNLPQPLSSRQWHSGFLPSKYQGVRFRSTGDSVPYVRNPAGITDGRQRDVLDAVRSLNQIQAQQSYEPEIASRISQYEMAFRMQTSVPDLLDISDEPEHVLKMYGTNAADGSFAFNCLLARRLAERGVRFIQLYHRGWDHHNDIKKFMGLTAPHVDRATAALIADLKQRDMLRDTLIVWGGEFGRTPMSQNNKGGPGRDHHKNGFSNVACRWRHPRWNHSW